MQQRSVCFHDLDMIWFSQMYLWCWMVWDQLWYPYDVHCFSKLILASYLQRWMWTRSMRVSWRLRASDSLIFRFLNVAEAPTGECPGTFSTGCIWLLGPNFCPANTRVISIGFCNSLTAFNVQCKATPAYYGGCCPGWTGVNCATRKYLVHFFLDGLQRHALLDVWEGLAMLQTNVVVPMGMTLYAFTCLDGNSWTGIDCNTR